MNQWRSPTAEEIYKNEPHLNCRSAGTGAKARRRVSLKDLQWADLVVVMEWKHRERLMADFREAMRHKKVEVLEVEDRYRFMAPELVEELRAVLDPILR